MLTVATFRQTRLGAGDYSVPMVLPVVGPGEVAGAAGGPVVGPEGAGGHHLAVLGWEGGWQYC